MKIDMTADEFRVMQQGNETLNNRVIDFGTKLNATAAALTKEQNDHYAVRQKLSQAEVDRDSFKRLNDQLTAQINDPNSGWRKRVTDLQTQIDQLTGKSAVPIAALKNFLTVAMGDPGNKKDAIDALKSLTLQSVKDATALWDEVRTSALALAQQRSK